MNEDFSSTNFPKNINAVIVAQNIISGIFSENISSKLNEAQEKYNKGELTKESLIDYTCAYREKMINPEEITFETVSSYRILTSEEISNHKNKFSLLTDNYNTLQKENNDTKERLGEVTKENEELQKENNDTKEKLSDVTKENIELQKYKKIVLFLKNIGKMFFICCIISSIICGLYLVYMYSYNNDEIKSHISFLSSILTIFSLGGSLTFLGQICIYFKKFFKSNKQKFFLF